MILQNQQSFNKFILQNHLFGFKEKPITLSSGRESQFYVNWRTIFDNAGKTADVADYILGFADNNGLKPDCFYGVPEGATKIGLITQFFYSSSGDGNGLLPMGRGKPKEHGDPKDRYFLCPPKGNIVVVEDVTTTAGSLLRTIDQLVQLPDARVIAAIGLTNRDSLTDDRKTVEQALGDRGVRYFALSNALTLLPIVYRTLKPSREIADAVEREFEQYGVAPLKLG